MSLITPDFGLLVWMTLIFGIVFFILAKFGFPAITSMVSKRAEHIEQALRDAQKTKEELDSMQQTCSKMLADARAQQEEMLEQARKSSAQMVENAKEEASKQAAQIIAVAREQIEVEKREAINDVRNVVVDMAIAVSEKVLREKLEHDGGQFALTSRILDELQENKKN